MKRELSKKAKLSIFKTVFVPILTYGHESWVMTERVRSQVQASEMRFLQRIEGVRVRLDWTRSNAKQPKIDVIDSSRKVVTRFQPFASCR